MDFHSLHLRLSDLNELVSEVFEQAFPGPFWVIAELASVTYAAAGHTYMDLVEKRGDEVVAQSRAQLWNSRREAVLRFEAATHSRLARGMQVLLLAQPVFHRRYGYGLEIQDIDANYTLGDMARKRQEVIDRLTDDGLIDRNRGLSLPPAPLRVAVISSATAAGWDDFQRRLAGNPDGYVFTARLFPALVQGNGAERSILSALSQIGKAAREFDCVAILRGGGGTVDLACFDSFGLGRAIAQFPLPVICGIGHDRDSSVCDLVSFHAAPTPTAAAEYLIARVRAFEGELDALGDAVLRCAQDKLAREASTLLQVVARIVATSQNRIRGEMDELRGLARRGSFAVQMAVAQRASELAGLETRVELLPGMLLRSGSVELARMIHDLKSGAHRIIERRASELTLLEREVQARDPAEVLRRGYSITRINGRRVRDAARVKAGTRIETTFYRGSVTSVVEKVETIE